ncbi:MAG: LmeA family phospholipid-binding protein [Armatimonadota bacterium]
MSTNRRSVIVLAAVIALIFLVSSAAMAGEVTPEKIETKIKRIITEKWTCKNLVVKVVPFQSNSLTQSGRFQAIVFSADSIYHNGVTVAPIYVKAFDVTLDLYKLYYKNDIRTKRRKNTIINAQISEKDINTLLKMKNMPVKNPKIDFQQDKLVFTGKYEAVFGHNLMMEAKLEVVDHRKINLVPTKVTVNGIPLPTGPVRSLLSKINPLLDLNEVPLTPKVDSLKVLPDHIEIKG